MDGRHERRLLVAGYLFAAGSAVHIADHLRRGQDSITAELNVAGTMALVVQAIVVTLVVTRHRVAPLAAVAAGFPLALGFLSAHWLPEWSPLSDPVYDIRSWFSYLASGAEVAFALVLGLAGLATPRRRGGQRASSASRRS